MSSPLSREQLAALRQDYILHSLDETDCGADPLLFFESWLHQALLAEVEEPTAMAISTLNARGGTSTRMVLLKGIEEGGFVFFTNYESDKAHDLLERPQASIMFFWPQLQRQVRVEGQVQQISAEQSAAYFQSRPRGSQLGAWASPQSKKIAHREELEERLFQVTTQYEGREVPCPPYWGGFLLLPERIEFWQGRSNRLHDRILFERSGDIWEKSRLAP